MARSFLTRGRPPLRDDLRLTAGAGAPAVRDALLSPAGHARQAACLGSPPPMALGDLPPPALSGPELLPPIGPERSRVVADQAGGHGRRRDELAVPAQKRHDDVLAEHQVGRRAGLARSLMEPGGRLPSDPRGSEHLRELAPDLVGLDADPQALAEALDRMRAEGDRRGSLGTRLPLGRAPERGRFNREGRLSAAERLSVALMQAKLLSLTVDAPSYTGTAEIFGRGWARARMWEQCNTPI
jgi:hypothetical protein